MPRNCCGASKKQGQQTMQNTLALLMGAL